MFKTQRQCPHARPSPTDLFLSMRNTFPRGLPKAGPRSILRKEALEVPKSLFLPPSLPLLDWNKTDLYPQPQHASLALGKLSPTTLVSLSLHHRLKVKRREGTRFKHLLCAKHCVGTFYLVSFSPHTALR